MESITYLNTSVDGITYSRILDMEIRHGIGAHGSAALSLEADIESAQETVNRIDEQTIISICTSADGQPATLFTGIVDSAGLELVSGYAVIRLELKSTSARLADAERDRSYQNTAMTHEKVMESALGGAALINMEVTDRPTGSIIVQRRENNWDFCKRMASRLGAPVIPSINTAVPVLSIGIPQSKICCDLSDRELMAETATCHMPDGFAASFGGTRVCSIAYLPVGADVLFGGRKRKVGAISANMRNGMLVTTVCMAEEKDFVQPRIENKNVAGKMYLGQVRAVRGDQVQVHLVDIDAEYDEGGDVWLPYSTAYSSNDGSGLYCMPAEGDMVRVFFPGSDEGKGFAASSVSVNVGADVTDKQWTGPEGKQILLTKEGIYITTNASDSKIFINLTDKDGITISSNKNINICAKKNLSIMSNDRISISAENDVYIGSAESFIDIRPEKIELGAENVVIV